MSIEILWEEFKSLFLFDSLVFSSYQVYRKCVKNVAHAVVYRKKALENYEFNSRQNNNNSSAFQRFLPIMKNVFNMQTAGNIKLKKTFAGKKTVK